MTRDMLLQPLLPLPSSFYGQDTLAAARQLLGKTLVRRFPDGQIATGRVVETEAYTRNDPACHAFRGLTERNKTMWGPPGRAYIHINYGLHFCLNAVTAPEGAAEAVLIRALEPVTNARALWRHTYGENSPFDQTEKALVRLTSGPGKLTRALGVDKAMDGIDLTNADGSLFLAHGEAIADANVVTTTRIGITKGADLPWRFYVRASPFVSRRGAQVPPT